MFLFPCRFVRRFVPRPRLGGRLVASCFHPPSNNSVPRSRRDGSGAVAVCVSAVTQNYGGVGGSWCWWISVELTTCELLRSVAVSCELTDPDEYHSGTSSADSSSSGGCSGSAMARSCRTDATGNRTSPNAGPDSTRSECQPGGHSTCAANQSPLTVAQCSTQPNQVNAGAQEGLEAWRAPVLHHEPTSLTRNAGLLQELLNFSFEGEITERLVQFDPRCRPPRESKRRELPEQHPYRSLPCACCRTDR